MLGAEEVHRVGGIGRVDAPEAGGELLSARVGVDGVAPLDREDRRDAADEIGGECVEFGPANGDRGAEAEQVAVEIPHVGTDNRGGEGATERRRFFRQECVHAALERVDDGAVKGLGAEIGADDDHHGRIVKVEGEACWQRGKGHLGGIGGCPHIGRESPPRVAGDLNLCEEILMTRHPCPLNNAEPEAPTPPPAAPTPSQPEEPKVSGTTTATAPERAKTPPVSRPLDQYKVLLHNAEEPTITFVVQAIVQIVPMATERALTVTMEAHTEGVALVTVTHLELAELYQDRFQSKGLTVTLEKA